MRDRIVAETRGNPRALLELARGLTPEELAGGFGLPGACGHAGPDRGRLPAAAGTVAVGDAAAATGRRGRADRRPGSGVARRRPTRRRRRGRGTAAAGLIEADGLVRFRHPLTRAAVYRAASPEERQRVHRALAEAIDPGADPDRRAWHLGHATAGLDESVAAGLERSADRARARGGLATAATFLDRAAELTPDPARRAQRALVAAQSKYWPARRTRRGGCWPWRRPDHSTNWAARVRSCCVPGWSAGSGRGGDAFRCCCVRRPGLEPRHPGLARKTYGDVFSAARTAGRLPRDGRMLEVAEAVRAARAESQPPHACDLLLDGLAVVTSEGYAAGAPMLKKALRAFRDRGGSRCGRAPLDDARVPDRQ